MLLFMANVDVGCRLQSNRPIVFPVPVRFPIDWLIIEHINSLNDAFV